MSHWYRYFYSRKFVKIKKSKKIPRDISSVKTTPPLLILRDLAADPHQYPLILQHGRQEVVRVSYKGSELQMDQPLAAR